MRVEFSVGDVSGFEGTYLIRPLEGTRNLRLELRASDDSGFKNEAWGSTLNLHWVSGYINNKIKS